MEKEFFAEFLFEGKVALVTGASYGIGFGIATAFAQCGATIVFNDIKQELVDKDWPHIRKRYRSPRLRVRRDGRNCRQCLGCPYRKRSRRDRHPRQQCRYHQAYPDDGNVGPEFRQVIDVDLNAPFIVSKAVIPGMIKKGHGKIINICSMMSELGRETVSAYAAAKGGLKMLTRNICSEYGEYNIQCNGIGPGYIATPQTAPLRERQPDGSRHPFDSFIVAKTPAARWSTPEDLQSGRVLGFGRFQLRQRSGIVRRRWYFGLHR